MKAYGVVRFQGFLGFEGCGLELEVWVAHQVLRETPSTCMFRDEQGEP